MTAVVFQRFVYLDKASQSWSPHGCVGLELCGAVFSVIPQPLGQMWQMLVFSWAWDQMSTGRSYIRPTSLSLCSFQPGFLGLLISEMSFKMCQPNWRLKRYSNIYIYRYKYATCYILQYSVGIVLNWSPQPMKASDLIDQMTGTVAAFALRNCMNVCVCVGWAVCVCSRWGGVERCKPEVLSMVEGGESLAGHPSGRKPACFLLTPTH